MNEWLHLTPKRNVAKILREGLRPVLGRTWLLRRERLTTAFADHIARHHDVSRNDLHCFYVSVPSTVRLTECQGKWTGFALVYDTIKPDCLK